MGAEQRGKRAKVGIKKILVLEQKVLCGWKTLFQNGYHCGVDLHRNDLRGTAQEFFRQCTEPRADLENRKFRRAGGFGNGGCGSFIHKKVLPQSPVGGEAMRL